MTVIRDTVKFVERFARAQALTTTPGENGWTSAATGTTPTHLMVTEDGGSLKLTLTSTSEEQIACAFHNDVLSYDAAKIQHAWWIAKVASVNSVTTIVFGLGSARNDTEDSVAEHAWFRMEGSASTSNIVVETDDGTTDNNDVATGTTLSSTYKKFFMDFSNGLTDVRFFVDGARVASATTFDMSSISSGQNLQPIAQLHKASGAGVPALQLAEFGIQYTTAYGA